MLTSHVLLRCCVFIGLIRIASSGFDAVKVVFETMIHNLENQPLGLLRLYSNEEVVDTLYKFGREHHLTPNERASLLDQLCSAATPNAVCTRTTALVESTWIRDEHQKTIGKLDLWETDEPADVVLAFSRLHNLNQAARRRILMSLCAQASISCTREDPVVFRENIQIEENMVRTLVIYEREEPIDAIYNFIQAAEVSPHLQLATRTQLFDLVCQSLPCRRNTPVIFRQHIQDPKGTALGEISILENQEPVDVVVHFATLWKLDRATRSSLVHQICDTHVVTCTRRHPIVFQIQIQDVNGTSQGLLQIQEDQETMDAIHAFGTARNMTFIERYALLERVCALGRTPCNRGRAVLYSSRIYQEDGSTYGQLVIHEEEEPADVIHAFAHAQPNNVLVPEVWQHLIQTVCAVESMTCTREMPILHSIPIAAANGSYLDHLHIQYGQEPIDAISPFCKHHDLSDEQKKVILKGVCDATQLPCTRNLALVTSIPVELETTQYWMHLFEDQEPTDMVYAFSQVHGLNFRQRKDLLIKTCREGQPHKFNCTRAEPALFKIPVMESAHAKLGDLEILEGQEPIDVVYAFLEKHDLFQTPANTSLIQAACSVLKCERERPRRELFSLKATWFGIPHTIRYVKPEEDWTCSDHYGGQKCIHYVETLSAEFCALHVPDWTNCLEVSGDIYFWFRISQSRL